jgi:prepilin-type N-terminal cleavage/methylation domain-containing protein
MPRRLYGRLRDDESGLTLLELVVVVIIMGILLALAVLSYLGFRDRAQTSAAKANIRSAVPAIEAYFIDNHDYAFDRKADGTPATVEEALRTYDAGLQFSGAHRITVVSVAGGADYCISATGSTGESWKKAGPASAIDGPTTAC